MNNTNKPWNFVLYLVDSEPSGINHRKSSCLMYPAVEIDERDEVLTYTPGVFELQMQMAEHAAACVTEGYRVDQITSRYWTIYRKSEDFRMTAHIRQGLLRRYTVLFETLHAIEGEVGSPSASVESNR